MVKYVNHRIEKMTMPRVRILVGDALSQLATLPDESVQCCVTSPPYWGLRSYGGGTGMIGLEPTLDEHLDNLVAVFREVRRVLRPDGTLWLNYGDAYAASGRAASSAGFQATNNKGSVTVPQHPKGWREANYKPKDLMMLPARVALALQADGWWLRSEIVWHKPNPMPESCTDRPTSAHEKIYLLTKRPRYFYDAEAVRTPSSGVPKMPDGWDTGSGAHGSVHRNGREKGRRADSWHGKARPTHAPEDAERQSVAERQPLTGANLRNVWTIPTQGFRDVHYAVFPTALVEPCIKAGTSEKGCCVACGAPWVRVVKAEPMEIRRSERTHDLGRTRSSGTVTKPRTSETTGWRPTCECAAETKPCVILDPFAGAGTVGLVADRLGRDAVLIEINGEYAEMAQARIQADAPLFTEVA